MLPAVLGCGQYTGASYTPLLVMLAFGATATFAVHRGDPTYYLVHGPGGYKHTDFLRVGLPLLLLYAVICIGFAYLYY
jgi:di/tricarboxylate transporter